MTRLKLENNMISFLLFGCLLVSHRKVGVIDIIENDVCSVQFDDATTIMVNSSLCKGLREGDTIKVKYDKSR